MTQILTSTQTTVVDEKKGLHTLLLSDEIIDVVTDDGRRKKTQSISIDTCFVRGNDNYPYETRVLDNEGNKLHQERHSEKTMTDYHLGQVEKYQTMFLKERK